MLTYHDRLQLGAVWMLSSLAVAFNLYLIVAIVLRTPKQLRTYAVFLFYNATIDLASATVSVLGSVRLIHDHEGTMIFVFLGPCTLFSEKLCRMCHALHTNFVQQSLVIILLSFAYHLYLLGDVFGGRPAKSPFQMGLLCMLSFLPLMLPTAKTVNYIEQTSVSQKLISRLHLKGYVTATFPIFFSPRAIILNIFICVFSPLVMTFIFIVRRKLIMRIEQAALTYQMLLPCGVAIGAALWLCDLTLIWSSEIAERCMMITYSLFSLASPIINLTVLPPYRAMLPQIFRIGHANVADNTAIAKDSRTM